MKTRTLLAAVLLAGTMVFSANAQAPYRDVKTPTTRDHLLQPQKDVSYMGILDASRISMSQQFGVGYAGFNGGGYTQAYYMNTLAYKFKSPVLMRLRLGVTNNPFASNVGTAPGQSTLSTMLNNAEFFGGADLLWKPSENFRFKLSINRVPASMYGYPGMYGYGYGYGYGYSPFGYNAYQMGDPGFNQIGGGK